jgi:hypothetical protein
MVYENYKRRFEHILIMKIKLILIIIFLLSIFTQKTYACGCGIAVVDLKVFNALKETQAYLLIDVKDKNTYDEMPFFRFVSMENPYNVTIVFPMDQIPYGVDGKKISAASFLSDYGISNAENYIKKQDVKELVKNVNTPLFIASNGAISILPFIFSAGMMGAPGGAMTNQKSFSPVAHFEFEGGTLDIYNVSSAQTLDEFVKTIGIETEGKVKDLVTKYKDYYVAVLKIKVPSLISEDKINYIEGCAPSALETIKNELSQKSEISFSELESMAVREASSCGSQGQEYLREYVEAATYRSDYVNGTLVIMKFNNSNFFYPTSIVNSYKYPINDQKYFVKVPDNLHIDLSSSSISKVANFDGQRWYKIDSTQNDLKGKVVDSNFLVSLGDNERNIIMKLNENPFWIIVICYILIFSLPLIIFRKSEKISAGNVGLTIITYLFGGLILSSIVLFIKKKRNVALTYFGIWIIMLIIFLSSGAAL